MDIVDLADGARHDGDADRSTIPAKQGTEPENAVSGFLHRQAPGRVKTAGRPAPRGSDELIVACLDVGFGPIAPKSLDGY
ncbi:MAG: hypothetical protein K9M02_14265 [Thiohalocapsa sp.]|nr:hypothetical protein [Thiohalocapsa sp.]